MTSKEYVARIHDLPCVVCELMGAAQTSPTEAHHIESVRDEDSNYAVAALCYDHHEGPNGVHGLSRRGFSTRYKLSDIDLMALTVKEYLKAFA